MASSTVKVSSVVNTPLVDLNFNNKFVDNMLKQEPTYLHIFVNKGLTVQQYLKHVAMAAYEAGLFYGASYKLQPELILLVAPTSVSDLYIYVQDTLKLSGVLYTDLSTSTEPTALALAPVDANVKSIFESYRKLVIGS